MAIRDRPQFGNRLPPEKNEKAVQTASLPNGRDAMLRVPSSGPSPFEAAARSEDAIRLAGQLQILPPLYREAFAAEVSRRTVSCGDGSGLGAPTTNGDVQKSIAVLQR